MKLATTTADFSHYVNSQEEAILHIKKAGFKCADYSFGMDYSKKTGVAGKNPKEYLEKIKYFADENGVEFVQAHAPMGRPLIKNEDYESFIEANKVSISACGILGIKNIVVHSGYASGLSKEETFVKNKEFYYELLPVAEKYGVNILTENFDKMCNPKTFWIDNANDMRELIDIVNHPLFHCCWDVGHANMQEMPQDEQLKILGKDVLAIHIQDNFGNDDNHIAPFFGSMNLDSIMHGLLDIEYNGYFTFESDGMLCPLWRKRKYEKDDRLLYAPIEIKDKAESLLYDIGKHILTVYNCFEE